MDKFFNPLFFFFLELTHSLPATFAKILIPIHDTTAKSLQGCKEKCLKKIKGVIGNLKAGKSILLLECNKRLFITKHTFKANITFSANYLRLCGNIKQRNNLSSWLIANHCCKWIINQVTLHTLCLLREHLHHAEAEVGLFVLCYSLLLGVKEWTVK